MLHERIIALNNVRKSNKFLKGAVKLGEITHNDEMIRDAKVALYNNRLLVKEFLIGKITACRVYNKECIKMGF